MGVGIVYITSSQRAYICKRIVIEMVLFIVMLLKMSQSGVDCCAPLERQSRLCHGNLVSSSMATKASTLPASAP